MALLYQHVAEDPPPLQASSASLRNSKKSAVPPKKGLQGSLERDLALIAANSRDEPATRAGGRVRSHESQPGSQGRTVGGDNLLLSTTQPALPRAPGDTLHPSRAVSDRMVP